MTADEFNQLSGELTARAMNEGVLKDEMSAFELVGILEQRKTEIFRFTHALAVQKKAKEQPLIVKADGFPPPRGN